MRKKVLNAAKDMGYVPVPLLTRSSGSRRRRARRQNVETTDGYVDDADCDSNDNSGE